MTKRIRLTDFVRASNLGAVVRNAWWYWPDMPPYAGKLGLGFVRASRITPAWRKAKKKQGTCPDLAVVSINDHGDMLGLGLDLVRSGVKVVWVVSPYEPTVYEFRPGRPLRRYDPDDRLRPPPFLRGFSPRVRDWIRKIPPLKDATASSETLFNPAWYRRWRPRLPCLEEVRALIDHDRPTAMGEEAYIFEDLLENEFPLLPRAAAESRLWGDLDVRVNGCRARPDRKKGWPIPFLGTTYEVTRTRAQGVLLVHSGAIARRLADAGADRQLNLLLVASNGIPRAHTRAFLRHLQDRFRLPIYLLMENTTWGYFIFSVLKRGLVAPYAVNEGLALKDVRYLGLRAGDLFAVDDPEHYGLRWNPQWNLRLRAMARYRYFRGRAWQQELAAFKAQGCSFESFAMLSALRTLFEGPQAYHRAVRAFVEDYLKPKLQSGDWLA